MAHIKTTWVDNVTPISAENLNNLERQYDEANAYANETFQKTTKVYGNVAYTDSIAAGATLIKNITLGGNHKHGRLICSGPAANSDGIIVFFGTDNLKTLVSGQITTPQVVVGSWSRRRQGWVTYYPTTGTTWGQSATGEAYLSVNDIYISGSNLVIVFKNNEGSGSRNLNCTIDWEVW